MPILFNIFLCFFFFSSLSYSENISQKNDLKTKPAIAKQGDLIVEVHNSGTLNKLWYRIGVLKNNTIKWGKHYPYDTGIMPSVAVYNNTVVETHQSEDSEELWYHVGTLDETNKKILWGSAHLYETGLHPNVALNDHFVIEVHQYNEYENYSYFIKDEPHTELIVHTHRYYKTGIIHPENQTIDWIYSAQYGMGANPAIAVQKNQIIELHETDNQLWSKTGTVNPNGIIQWEMSTLLDQGASPSLAIDGNLLVEIHKSENFDRLWYHIGKINAQDNSITWSRSHLYDSGINPSILLDDHCVIEVHTSSFLNTLSNNMGFIDDENQTIIWNDSLANS